MSVTVPEWPPVEVQCTENLPENFLGLLEWVLDESVVTGEYNLNGDVDHRLREAVGKNSPGVEAVASNAEQGQNEAELTSSLKELSVSDPLAGKDDDKDKSLNDSIVSVEQDQGAPSHRGSKKQDSQPKSISSVNTARKKLLELAAKWNISSEAIQDHDRPTPAAKDSFSSWSISALGEDPITPPNKISPQKTAAENIRNDGLSPKIEELYSSSKPHSMSVAAWVMDTQDAPVPNLVIPKATNAAAHCCAIDPETGAFLPAIEHPETRYNHELDLQSDPGWPRSNITSNWQIKRELKARARLAQRVQERLPVQAEADGPVLENENSAFPKADCSIRPATDDDIRGISDIINLEQQKTSKDDRNKASSGIRSWDIAKIFNKCKKEQRPFIVATGAEMDILDRSKWPAGADRAYEEYVKYRSKSAAPQAAIAGFAFAMPRQVSSLDAQEIRTDHSCYVTLFVHPQHRNKKFASALLDRILMSVSPVHRSLIDLDWKCDNPAEIYEQPASNNAKQYARIFVEYLDAHAEDQRLPSRKKLLEKFGFSQVGHLSCLRSESRGGKRHWLDLLIWELEAQSLENVR